MKGQNYKIFENQLAFLEFYTIIFKPPTYLLQTIEMIVIIFVHTSQINFIHESSNYQIIKLSKF